VILLGRASDIRHPHLSPYKGVAIFLRGCFSFLSQPTEIYKVRPAKIPSCSPTILPLSIFATFEGIFPLYVSVLILYQSRMTNDYALHARPASPQLVLSKDEWISVLYLSHSGISSNTGRWQSRSSRRWEHFHPSTKSYMGASGFFKDSSNSLRGRTQSKKRVHTSSTSRLPSHLVSVTRFLASDTYVLW